jgi:lipopolysaccharide export system permease protein
MRLLDRYVIRQFFPILIAALSMFMTLVILIDLFMNLFRFLDNGAAIGDILKVSAYYIPKSFIFALPVALLFASAYTLGDLYTRNELSMVLCSGIPFWRFCVPLFVIGVTASFFSFFFEDHAVVPALTIKNAMTKNLLHSINLSTSSDLVIRSGDGKIIYSADFFDGQKETLNGVNIIELNDDYSFRSLIRSPKALWKETYWELVEPYIYEWDHDYIRSHPMGESSRYDEEPETFRRSAVDPAELKAGAAAMHIKSLKKAGLPYSEAQAEYYHRFSFSAISFVVIFLSVTMGGRFKKNILLMSLLSSLGTAVIYYVVEMLSMMSAKMGMLPPLAGAWIPVIMCIIGGLFLLRYAKT